MNLDTAILPPLEYTMSVFPVCGALRRRRITEYATSRYHSVKQGHVHDGRYVIDARLDYRVWIRSVSTSPSTRSGGRLYRIVRASLDKRTGSRKHEGHRLYDNDSSDWSRPVCNKHSGRNIRIYIRTSSTQTLSAMKRSSYYQK